MINTALLTYADSILSRVKQMTLTTIDGAQSPYSVIVYFCHQSSLVLNNEFLGIYWISNPSREHSIHIKHNQNISIAVSSEFQPGDKTSALFLNGTAVALEDKAEVSRIWPLMKEKIAPFFKDAFLENHLMYRADIVKVRVWDETGIAKNLREVIILDQHAGK